MQYRAQRRRPHLFGGVRKSFCQKTDYAQHVIGIDAQIEEAFDVDGGGGVGPQEYLGVGIVHLRQSGRMLKPGQLLQIQSGLFADLAGRDVGTVVAERPAGGQQHRGE